MIIIDMMEPSKNENVMYAFFNLVKEIPRNGNQAEFHTNVKNLLKSKYNYDIEFIFDETHTLIEMQINTDQTWFVLKHG